MQVNVTTFAGRKQQYVHETLESLLSSDWGETKDVVNLILGSEDESHVREYASHPSVRIVPWDAETNPSLRLNCTLNKIRALRHGDGDGDTLICEDDIVFPPNWFSMLQQATAELGEGDYILSLFASAPALQRTPLLDGMNWIKEYPTRVLYGAQAIYYPTKEIRLRLAQYLAEHLTEGCGDHLIGRYARSFSVLFVTKESLVDNIGAISCFHK